MADFTTGSTTPTSLSIPFSLLTIDFGPQVDPSSVARNAALSTPVILSMATLGSAPACAPFPSTGWQWPLGV